MHQLDGTWVEGNVLLFHDEGPIGKGRPTRKFTVYDRKSFTQIGFVKWFAPWRQYVFYPLNVGLLPSMMEDAIEFCKASTKAQKKKET